VPLASARSGHRERVFMITGIGVHDRTDWPFTITGMRKELVATAVPRLPLDSADGDAPWKTEQASLSTARFSIKRKVCVPTT
jgi:hypothetical protein